MTRNTGQGPGLARLDLRIGKLFGFPRPIKYRDHNSKNFEVSVDLFNAFNHTNLDSFVGVRGSPFFGRANSALPARTIQFSTRYTF